MTPGSAGGELGNHGALRLGWVKKKKKNHPRPRDSVLLPSLPVPPPPISFCQNEKQRNGRNLRSAGSAPFGSAQLPPLLPFTLSFRPGSTEVGWREPLDRRCECVEAVLSLDQCCLADKRASDLGSATLKETLYWSCCLFCCFGTGPSTVCLVSMSCLELLSGVVLCKWNISFKLWLLIVTSSALWTFSLFFFWLTAS